MVELPLSLLKGHRERKRLGGTVSPPPWGMPGGVTPALRTVWATGEEKIGVQREHSQEGPSVV